MLFFAKDEALARRVLFSVRYFVTRVSHAIPSAPDRVPIATVCPG
jgi:hypothetical protein